MWLCGFTNCDDDFMSPEFYLRQLCEVGPFSACVMGSLLLQVPAVARSMNSARANRRDLGGTCKRGFTGTIPGVLIVEYRVVRFGNPSRSCS